MPMKTEKPGVFRAWVLASRPKTLAAAAVPVLVGCALAYSDGCFRWPEALLCTLFAFLMQIDANLINDLFDYLKGSDGGDRLGPRRACAEGWIAPRAMKRGILCTTLAACVAGLGLLRYGGPELIAVGAVCVLFAFLYTAGPYPLAYHGWGDLLVVLFFGFVPVGCIYYIMCHSWDGRRGGCLFGLRFGDRHAADAEQLPRPRAGRAERQAHAGRALRSPCRPDSLSGGGSAAVLLCLWFVPRGRLWAGLLPLLYLPFHAASWRRMTRIGSGKALNRVLGETSRNMLLWARRCFRSD